MRPGWYWLGWGAVACAASVYVGGVMTTDAPVAARRMFLPGATTDGHYQIELACETCHTPFEGVTEAVCVGCHGAELAAVDDSHPKSKFTDPRNAELATRLDARSCVTCHREHHPAVTRAMGVTQQDDYCVTCHEDVGRDRPSHAGLAFTTCASAGCHNYHDNTALYEDFLVRHAGQPALLPQPRVPGGLRPAAAGRPAPLTAPDHDAPDGVVPDAALLDDWADDAHARAGVNCTGCHAPSGQAWTGRPGLETCASCHDAQHTGFLAGRHGMRLASGLDAMRPALARLPMRAEAGDRTLSCSSCHGAHRFDTRTAAAAACLGCHDDDHSRAWERSPHAAAWRAETAGAAPAGSGVSCGTCHLPRETRRDAGRDVWFVQHNQNLNLRPNEKMLRTACLHCHGLAFAIDALADRDLVHANFTGTPARHVDSIGMALRRLPSASPAGEARQDQGGPP